MPTWLAIGTMHEIAPFLAVKGTGTGGRYQHCYVLPRRVGGLPTDEYSPSVTFTVPERMLQQVRKPRRFGASERMNLQAHYDLEIRRD
jgi:hypothetical protein